MSNFVKWIGGGLGWAFGGPMGGVLGFIAGTVYDSLELNIFRKSDGKTSLGDFSTSLLVLIAEVLRAEGPIVKSELDYVKQFLKNNFGEKGAGEALTQLREILKQNNPLDDVCRQIRDHLDYSSRLQLIHFLNNLANVDGQMTIKEHNIINYITNSLKVNTSSKRTVGALLNAHDDSTMAAYQLLGIDRTTSILDIKKAYRKLANKYHPDKVAFLGDDMKKVANDKFQQLTRAYDLIKKERNFS